MSGKLLKTFTYLGRSILLLCIMVSFLQGCNLRDSQKEPVPKEIDEASMHYIEDANGYELKAIDQISEIPFGGTPQVDRELFFSRLEDGKSYISTYHTTAESNLPFLTDQLYIYDIKTDDLKKIKDVKSDTCLAEFIYYDNAYFYIYLELSDNRPLYQFRVVEERDGVEKELVRSKIENRMGLAPEFHIIDNTLYFMMSDIVPKADDYKEAVCVQRLYSYKNGKLSVELESQGDYKNYRFTEGTDFIGEHKLYIQPTGTFMVQQFHSQGSTLHYKLNDKWSSFDLASSEDFLRGYLSNNVILYDRAYNKNVLLNLETNDRTVIDNDDELREPLNYYGGTSMIYQVDKEIPFYLIMSLQKDGSVKTQELDFFKHIGYDDNEYRQFYCTTDGENIIFGYQEPGNYGKYHFYLVTYPESTS